MTSIGTPLSPSATRVLFCGGGELGKEVVIELQRLGVEVIVVDRYENAPAMQVAHRSHVISMLDGAALRSIIETEKPDYIVPEIEAIATDTLLQLESEGFTVIPTARAARLTMNREGIRRLAAEELGIPTSPYQFAETHQEFVNAVKEVGIPCVIKPIMSSSGKGQSTIKSEDDIESAWEYAQEGGRSGAGKVIIEGFVDFDYEITQLTVRHLANDDDIHTSFCEPIGHVQVDGDYRQSWQPQAMSESALIKAREIAEKVTSALGGRGIFGVELFIKGDDVIFSEVSPRPHDTGMVTMISQDLSQFALHARAILGLPIPNIHFHGPSASSVILAEGETSQLSFEHLDEALQAVNTQIRLFGKPEVSGQRRMGVVLGRDESIEKAVEKVVTRFGRLDILINNIERGVDWCAVVLDETDLPDRPLTSNNNCRPRDCGRLVVSDDAVRSDNRKTFASTIFCGQRATIFEGYDISYLQPLPFPRIPKLRKPQLWHKSVLFLRFAHLSRLIAHRRSIPKSSVRRRVFSAAARGLSSAPARAASVPSSRDPAGRTDRKAFRRRRSSAPGCRPRTRTNARWAARSSRRCRPVPLPVSPP